MDVLGNRAGLPQTGLQRTAPAPAPAARQDRRCSLGIDEGVPRLGARSAAAPRRAAGPRDSRGHGPGSGQGGWSEPDRQADRGRDAVRAAAPRVPTGARARCGPAWSRRSAPAWTTSEWATRCLGTSCWPRRCGTARSPSTPRCRPRRSSSAAAWTSSERRRCHWRPRPPRRPWTPSRPVPGQVVLVNGAGGGVGSFALQLLAARGAIVVATGSATSRDRLLGLGARTVVDYTVGSVVEQVRAASRASTRW